MPFIELTPNETGVKEAFNTAQIARAVPLAPTSVNDTNVIFANGAEVRVTEPYATVLPLLNA